MTLETVISPRSLRDWPLPVGGDSKHARGHVVVVGGSPATPGAVLLAGLAALRAGAGVLALAVPDAVAVPLAVAVPEAMVRPLTADVGEIVGDADAVLLGPGLDDPQLTRELVTTVVSRLRPDAVLVADAFALGVWRDLAADLPNLEGRLVMTPNSREAGRLLDVDDAPDEAGVLIADRFGAVVSYQSSVLRSGDAPRNVDTGHAGLGTSGSGDVLAGAVAGVAARTGDALQAACWATYLHAAAGDRLAARIGATGFLARELLDEIPVVLSELQS